MNNGKKLIWAILSGMPHDSAIVREALADPQTAREMLETTRLSKTDLLSAEGQSQPLIANEQVWNNLPLIAEMLRENGEELTVEDLTTAPAGGRTPVSYAQRLGKLDKLFSPEIWKGRMRDMERVYFAVDKVERDKLNLVQIRRAAAAAGGELTLEDRLTSFGLNIMTVRTNMHQGNVTDLRAALARHNETISKEYVFILDSAGDSIFEFPHAFEAIDAWLPDLEANGERLTKEDFLTTMVEKRSALDFAVKHNKLNKVFRARLWAGHANEMMELFEALPQIERNKVNINAVLGELKETEYGAQVSTTSLAALTRVLNEHERDSANFFPVHALGFEKVWKDMANVRAGLAARGERLTLSHLRQPSGVAGDTVLLLAARTGRFDQVMAIAAESREFLTQEELTAPGPQGKSVMDTLVERGEAATVLKPEHWVGRGRELQAVWNAIPAVQRDKIDFEAINSRVNMLTLRQRMAAGPRPGLG